MKKRFKKDDIEQGLGTVFREFLLAAITLISYDKKQKELNYLKKAITMPNGGIYLVSILHIDGPKLDISLLRDVSESQKPEESNVGGDSTKAVQEKL